MGWVLMSERELKRNHYDDKEYPELNGYYGLNAQAMYEKRRAIHCRTIVYPDLKAAIEDRLKGCAASAHMRPLCRHSVPNRRLVSAGTSRLTFC